MWSPIVESGRTDSSWLPDLWIGVYNVQQRQTVSKPQPDETQSQRLGDIRYINMTPTDESFIRTKFHLKEGDSIDIAEAEILVSGGRGMAKAENFGMLEELAQLLGGTVSASRPCVDAGWISSARQVGQTGKTVAPKIYMAFGISGAIQHLAGISGADYVIAVNRDENAPIFGVANLGIVGDVMEIIPALIEALKKVKAGN